jgi:hypothetical protein
MPSVSPSLFTGEGFGVGDFSHQEPQRFFCRNANESYTRPYLPTTSIHRIAGGLITLCRFATSARRRTW